MASRCIACGGEMKDVRFTGELKGMEVDFCEDHAHYCENCDRVVMKVIKKN
jgi:hypothetical protein